MNGIRRRLVWIRLLFGAFRAGVLGPPAVVRLYRASDFRLPTDEVRR